MTRCVYLMCIWLILLLYLSYIYTSFGNSIILIFFLLIDEYEYELCYCLILMFWASLIGIVPCVACFNMKLYKVIVWKIFFLNLINVFESGKVKSFQAYKVIV